MRWTATCSRTDRAGRHAKQKQTNRQTNRQTDRQTDTSCGQALAFINIIRLPPICVIKLCNASQSVYREYPISVLKGAYLPSLLRLCESFSCNPHWQKHSDHVQCIEQVRVSTSLHICSSYDLLWLADVEEERAADLPDLTFCSIFFRHGGKSAGSSGSHANGHRKYVLVS